MSTPPQLPPPGTPPPGWYPDPNGVPGQRYWDGATWTQHRAAPQQAGFTRRPSQPANGMAIAALVCGIVGVVLGLIPFTFFLALVLGVCAVVFGPLGWNRANKVPAAGRKGIAIAGTVLGIVAILLGVIGAFIVDDTVDDINQDLESVADDFDEELDLDELNRELNQGFDQDLDDQLDQLNQP